MVDASSEFQNSLPLSSDALLETLKEWSIPYNLFEHVPLRTVEDSKKVYLSEQDLIVIIQDLSGRRDIGLVINGEQMRRWKTDGK